MTGHSPSIAVLPFEDLSNDPDAAGFARGFVEDLIADLSCFPPLRVVANQSSSALPGLDRPPREVAREWQLDYLLEGSVRLRGGNIRITTRLIRVDGDETVWSERFDSPLDGVFDIQDEITSMVAGKLAGQIADAQLARARRAPRGELQAWDCWLRGMDCLNRATLESDEEARDFFRQALEVDPAYARAWAGLSVSHFNEWTCQAWHLWDESVENSFDYAMRAAELDGSDAMVQAVLARVCRFRHQHERADEHAARALQLNPNDPHVLIQIALTTLYNGEPHAALALAEKAMRANPLHPHWYAGTAGWCHFMAGRPGEALPLLARAGQSVVNFAAYRTGCLLVAGQRDKAVREFDRFVAQHREQIAFGRETTPNEAVRWAVQVEPFRHLADSRRMPDLLRHAGLVDVDVEDALATRSERMVKPADIARPSGQVFANDGGVWTFDYDGAGARLGELKGFHDIARLLAEPHTPIHCLELSGAAWTPDSRQDVLDADARRAYRQKIEEIQAELDQAQADHDEARTGPLRDQLEAVIDELARAAGLRGRPRALDDRAERARSAATWRIRSAIRKITAAHPRLGQHLSNSIRTGTFCVYAPETDTPWTL